MLRIPPSLNHDTRTHFAVGDIHGNLDGFQKILTHAQLIDKKGNWNGKNVVLAQLGDVIDRGPKSFGAWRYLQKLQMQAKQSQGKVVRLLGNHEDMLCQGYETEKTRPLQKHLKLQKLILQDIKQADVQAVYHDGYYTYSHAGFGSEVLRRTIEKIEKKNPSWQDIAAVCNLHFRNIHDPTLQVSRKEHPYLHQVPKRRPGGKHPRGGILWEDYRDLSQSVEKKEEHFAGPQIVGHTTNPVHYIRSVQSGRLICIDSKILLNCLSYLKIDYQQGRIEKICRSRYIRTWKAMPIYVCQKGQTPPWQMTWQNSSRESAE